MSLRAVCRELVLEVVLRRALNKSADSDSIGRLQLVVDAPMMRVLSSFLLMSDMHEGGVTSMELLERKREPLPQLDGLYLVRATDTNVELIVKDFNDKKEDKEKKDKKEDKAVGDNPQHRHVHLAFTQIVTQELMEKLAEAPKLSQRVKSMVEVPLSFVVIQDRGFHLDMPSALPALFPTATPFVVGEVVHGLADACRCLHSGAAEIRRGGSEACKEVARRLEEKLLHLAASVRDKDRVASQVLIVDRSFDMAAPLVHEYTYEAMTYDLLDGGMLDAERNIVRMKAPAKEVLLSEADALWEELKHQHLQDARVAIDRQTQEISEKARVATRGNVSEADLLRQLRNAPEYAERIERLTLHTSMVSEIQQCLNREMIMTPIAKQDMWGLLEQDIACGIDANGKPVKVETLQTSLRKCFTERAQALPSETKLRLLLLYLSCVANVNDVMRQQLIDAAQLAPNDQAVLMTLLQTKLAEVPDHKRQKSGASAVHRVTEDQAACFKANARSGGFDLSRFEPRVKLLIRQLLNGRLSEEEFPSQSGAGSDFSEVGLRTAAHGLGPPVAPAAGAVDDWSFAGAAAPQASQAATAPADVTQRIIVFVLGGITHSELRAVAELKSELPPGVEVILGGTSILTARRLISSLRPPEAKENPGSCRAGSSLGPSPSSGSPAWDPHDLA